MNDQYGYRHYYAHKAHDGRLQTIEDHLTGTAERARRFADAFQAGDFGYMVGMAHDIGKCTDGFQNRLNGGPIVDHSTAGALECAKSNKSICALCGAGHHSGLPDFGNSKVDPPGAPTLIGRLKKAIIEQNDKPLTNWAGHLPDTPDEPLFAGESFARSLWGRMLFSSLVDADFLDTEAFMENRDCNSSYDSIPTLCDKLCAYTEKWKNPTNELNRLRCEIMRDCIGAAKEQRGLFSLTVPTGGGKTVSSLAFALNHAKYHGLDRVIYVIPYTSIIEQNAAVFREILGAENVLEHHSEAEPIMDDDMQEQASALATENWDAPVIVTTSVQFFESLYANKPSKCRKLHNIANSVVIFDEAQMIPTCHLLPCVAAIGTLVKHFGVSAVLCTATQPFVSDILGRYAAGCPAREINRDVNRAFSLLKRVTYEKIGKQSSKELADHLSRQEQVLCVVNSRKAAKEVFALLPCEGSFHLSTLMTPKHRKETLATIRKCLKDGQPCRVVSTSLMEAGVDIDFPVVYREMSGLDSIVQAAGRCNREGKRSANESVVYIFELDNRIPPLLQINIGAAKEALTKCADPGDVQTIDAYFHSYRDLMRSIDKTNAVLYLSEGLSGCVLPYKTVAESFHLIDQVTKTVYIPDKENRSLIDALREGRANREVFRELGKYSVNIYEKHYQTLYDAGDIEETPCGSAILINEKLYNGKTGLSLEADAGKAEFI